MNFLKNLVHKLKECLFGPKPAPSSVTPVKATTEPRRSVIAKEPMVALKDGKLVLVIDHAFEDMPSWIEWDHERQVLSFVQMGGELDEVKVKIRKDHYKVLEQSRKALLVSNDNKGTDEKIVHYVSFVSKGK